LPGKSGFHSFSREIHVEPRRPRADAACAPRSIHWPGKIGEAAMFSGPANIRSRSGPSGWTRRPIPGSLWPANYPSHRRIAATTDRRSFTILVNQPACGIPTAAGNKTPTNGGGRFLPVRASANLSLGPLLSVRARRPNSDTTASARRWIAEPWNRSITRRVEESASSPRCPLHNPPGSASCPAPVDFDLSQYCILYH